MDIRQKLKISLLGIALAMIGHTASAVPIAYNIFQGGYSEGATITGMITLDDLDMDGTVGGFPGPPEVVSLMGAFSGNGLVPAFTFDELDLFGFIWFSALGPFVGDDGIPPTEGLGATPASGFTYQTGLGPEPLLEGGGRVTAPTGAFDTSFMVLMLTLKVPEPTTLALMGLGLAGLGYGRKRTNTA